jgi:hypothetical protein
MGEAAIPTIRPISGTITADARRLLTSAEMAPAFGMTVGSSKNLARRQVMGSSARAAPASASTKMFSCGAAH